MHLRVCLHSLKVALLVEHENIQRDAHVSYYQDDMARYGEISFKRASPARKQYGKLRENCGGELEHGNENKADSVTVDGCSQRRKITS